MGKNFYLRVINVLLLFSVEMFAQINLSPMWAPGKYWKPQTYAPDHGGIGLYYAVDFYNTKFNRPDLYFNNPSDYTLEDVDEPIYSANSGAVNIELTYMKDNPDGLWPQYDGINVPHHCFSLNNGTIKIDMAVKVVSSSFRTIYAHLEIDGRFFSSNVIQMIKDQIAYFQQNGTAPQSILTSINVNAREKLGTINKYGAAQMYHLHFQVKEGNDKVDLSDPNKAKIEGQTIFDLSLQDSNYKFPAMKRTKYLVGTQVIVSSAWEGSGKVNVRYTRGGTVIDSVRDGTTGLIIEGPSPGILDSRSHLWYRVQFANINGWVASEYLGPYNTGNPNPTLTSSIQISPSSSLHVGQTISGTFTISNKSNNAITFAKILIGGRLNDNNNVKDFPAAVNITLNPNQSYIYQANFTFREPGNYKFFPAYQTVDSLWKTSLYNEIPTESGVISLINISVSILPQSFSISGRVVDDKDNGIDAVTVTLSIDKNSTVLTNTEGYYTLDSINSGGTYEVTPSKEGYDFNPASHKYVEQRQNQTADFVGTQKQYKISCGVSPQGWGVTEGCGSYPLGRSIALTAKPSNGWSFVNWAENDVQQSTDVNYTFTVYDNRNLIANFRQIPQYYTITCISNPTNGGSTSGCDVYLKNTQINLHAIANAGYQFVNWTESGTVVSSNPFYSLTVTGNKNLIANFSNIPYAENLTKPNKPAGQSIGVVNKSYEFYLGGAISNYSDRVQYYVDWGDGSNSGWLPIGTTILQHSWNSPGIYNVKECARCATHTNIISEWSDTWAVNITEANSNWIVKHTGGANLMSVYFVDANKGWVVGGGSTILHTTDSGNNWAEQSSPVAFCSFYSVYFKDSYNGWVCGINNNTQGGIIIHTTDGGNNWFVQYNEGNDASTRVWWLTGLGNGNIVAAWNNGFLSTHDYGNTWQSKIMSPLWKVRKGAGNALWATTKDGKVINSNDDGNSWLTKYIHPSGSNPILDVASVGANVWGVGELPNFKIIYSSNEGNSWQDQNSGGLATLRSVFFMDEQNGWAVDNGMSFTKNGGQTWNVLINPTPNLLYDVFYSSGIIWAAGDQGTVLKLVDTTSVQVTINSLPTGRQVAVDQTDFTTPATFNWNKNSTHTIAASNLQSDGTDKRFIWNSWNDDGTISHTITVNSNFTYTANFTTQYSITAQSSTGGTVDPQTGWFDKGQTISLQAKANGGYRFVNWTENGKEVSTSELYQFVVTNSRNLLANFSVADYKVTLISNPPNGGMTSGYGIYNNGQTTTVAAQSNSEFNFVNWTESGNVVQTNSSFPITVVNDRRLVANFLIKPSLVVKPGILEVTETTGTSQLRVSNTKESTMNWFATADSGWLSITSGNSGTNNGVIDFSYQANMSSRMRKGTITVVSIGAIGSPMIIEVRQQGTVTAVENEIKKPDSFKLYQNYPNPFNPTTKIKFSIPAETRHGASLHVLLKVFDVLGREVATLINEEKSPGNYEIKFNGTSLPSGVYFYRLSAGSFVETKKFILLK